MKKLIASAIVVLSFILQSAFACTIFSLYPNNSEHWIGRTFDWAYGHGFVYTNKRNVTKTSLKLLPTDVTSSWTSKYGSVTFNQFGKEFPTGGMNEEGLMIDALELLSSAFPAADARPSFNELQFIQYILDNFKTVEEIKAVLPNLRLAPVGSKLHYFACDVKHCMTIEYLNGVVVTHLADTLPISGLANNTYDESINYAKDFVTFGGIKPVVLGSKESLNRFVRSNYNAKTINTSQDKTQTLFAFLDDVGSVSNRWQIIYNQTAKVITFRTKTQFDKQRVVNLNDFNFDCHSEVQYFDLDSELGGAINADFKSFDPNANYTVIKKSVDLQKLPAALAGRLAIYPNETKCSSSMN